MNLRQLFGNQEKEENDNLPSVYRRLSKESDTDSMANIPFNVKVEIDEEVHKKIMYWVHKSNFEVSGLGKVVVDEATNTIRVIDAVLVKQDNSSVTTEMDAAAVGKAMYLLKDTPGDLRFWWHSHVNMDVFWSGTDQATIKQLAMGGWFVSTVFNKKNEMKTAFSQSSPIRFVIDDVATSIENAELVVPEWDKEYNENVTTKSYDHYTQHQGSLWNEDAEEVARAVGVEVEDEEATEVVDCTAEYEAKEKDLMDRLAAGKITDEQFQTLMDSLDEEYQDIEDDASDEEAEAMDLATAQDDDAPPAYRRRSDD